MITNDDEEPPDLVDPLDDARLQSMTLTLGLTMMRCSIWNPPPPQQNLIPQLEATTGLIMHMAQNTMS